MTEKFHKSLMKKSNDEPFGGTLGLEAMEVGPGFARVRMRVRPELQNIFGGTHGGAVFSLLDEAFQLACNSHGVLSVALNVSITYAAAPSADSILEARVKEINKTKRTASYFCEVRETEGDRLIATAQALAFRTGREIDFA